jgi:enoyl-CoA hydratase/3-hydroxyacyl-CoA dehydrogenase
VERRPTDIEVPSNLIKQCEQNQPWPISFVDLHIKDGVATILFNRPEVMNALNEEVMRQLDDRFEKANADPSVKAIVLRGAGKTFIAGAEIGYFIDKIETNHLDDIVDSTIYWHAIVAKFQESDKLVIAVLDGLAIGGGVEVALAADTIVATERGTIAFPETGIGIYPGLGGTQRAARYLGRELAKWLIFTGKTVDAKTAASIGLVEYVVSQEDIDARIAELANSDNVITKSAPGGADLPAEFVKIKELFSDENLQSLLNRDENLDELGQKLAKTISYKAPHAIRISNKLIDEGGLLDLKAGLRMELDHLVEIFSTKDALEGLKSVIERRRATFTGE